MCTITRRIPHSAALTAFLATLGAMILAPLFVFTLGLTVVLIVWITHVSLIAPWVLTATYDADSPGGGVEATTGPGFLLVVGAFVAAAAAVLYRLRRRADRDSAAADTSDEGRASAPTRSRPSAEARAATAVKPPNGSPQRVSSWRRAPLPRSPRVSAHPDQADLGDAPNHLTITRDDEQGPS